MKRIPQVLIALTMAAVSSGVTAQRLPPPTRYLVPPGLFDLDEKQRKQISEIRRDLHNNYCEVTGALMDIQDELHQLYSNEKRDPRQVGETFRKMSTLQQQLLEARINAENRVEAVLDPEQRRQLRNWRRGQLRGVYSADDFPYQMYPGIQENRSEIDPYPYPGSVPHRLPSRRDRGADVREPPPR